MIFAHCLVPIWTVNQSDDLYVHLLTKEALVTRPNEQPFISRHIAKQYRSLIYGLMWLIYLLS